MLEHILIQVADTVISISATAGVAGLVWLATLRSRSNSIRTLISNPERQFEFFYRGSQFPEMKKRLTFLENGCIGEGSNSNEYKWKVAFGKLIIINAKNEIYSKFRWEQRNGILQHTNDPSLPSVLGQYIIPSFVKPDHT